jgi:hypothetical protein
MESWRNWEDFLKIMSRDNKLTDAETESFLLQFARENLGKGLEEIAAQLPQMENSLGTHKKRMSEVYGKFSQSCVELKSITHKSKPLQKWLETKYSQWLSDQDFGSALSSATTETPIDWRDICDKVLETQQLRRQATAQQYELNIYVPLGLMERPKTRNPRPNGSGKDSRAQQEPELQIVETYKDDAFFQKVITVNHTEKRTHIAIIGEPGAGKTTLLGKLAEYLPKNPPDFPICIRLADLQGSTIKDYLVNNWLEKAVEHIESVPQSVTPEIIESLKQLFRQGKVWLLLDGVDEMAATSPIEALAKIRDQLTDWVGKARVVLTCRLNVWDAAISNTLTDFDTYKTLEFEPDDVDKFICQWFEQASQDEKRRNSGNETYWLEQGKRLQQELKEPGKDNIRRMVRNPLRLLMLCQSWCVPEPDLPKTKAALYEQFTTYFFEWKQEEFQKKHQRVLKETEKKQIKQALAKLALAAMETANRFRIEQEFAIEQMEEEWFDLADEWGWLVLVDRDTRTKKPVYAFFHATFEEYFAACAIEDWDFFLNHVPHNPKQGIYRIFEKQWKEVILLWLGRENVETEKKEEFIKTLVEFNDGCNGFYWYQAYFSAAVGIAEFKDCSIANEIVEQIVKLGFGYFNEEKQEWIHFIDPIAEGAREALLNTQITKAIAALADWVQNSQNEYTRWIAAFSFEKIGKDNPIAINALVYLLDNSQNGQTQYAAAESLEVIGKDNPIAIALLEELLQNCQNEYTLGIAARSLGVIEKDNQLAIATLVQIIKNSQNEFYRLGAVWDLQTIDENHPTVIPALVDLSQNCQDKFTRFNAAQSLLKIDKNNHTATVSLVNLIYNNQDEIGVFARSILEEIDEYNPIINADLVNLKQNYHFETTSKPAAFSLEEIEKANITVNAALVNFIQECQNEDNCYKAVSRLKDVLTVAQMPEVVNTLNKYLVDNTYSNDSKINVYCYQVIGHCAQHMSYPEFYQSWNIKSIDSYNKYLQIQRLLNNRQSEAYCLFTIGTLYKKNGKFWEGLAYIQQAMEILEEIDLPLDDYPIHSWVKWVIKFDQNAILKIGVPIMLVLIIFSVWQFLLD